MAKGSFGFYLLIFLIVFVPSYLPVPFAPEFLYRVFGGKNGGLLTFTTVLIFILLLISLLFKFLYELAISRRFNKLLLLEIFSVPLICVGLLFLSELLVGDTPRRLASMNYGRQPEEFQNPYLNYEMLDCRSITDEFDVIFIPRHINIETEYLAYAPRRKDKTIGYIPGKKYGDDWYWEFTGSQWDEDLIKCRWQNRSPNN